MSNLSKGLSPEQMEVVTATSGHHLILAGPGSGKTHTVTAKLVHLFESGVVAAPYRIAALTFTSAAAREMTRRLRQFPTFERDRLFCGTYHAFGQYLLRHFGRSVGIREDFALDPVTAQQVLEDVAARYPRFDVEGLGRRIESCKRSGILPSALAEPQDQEENEFAAAYAAYQDRLRELNTCDFGDTVLFATMLLTQHPAIRHRVRNAYRYVLADEFQDTDEQQLSVVLSLAEGQASTIVADDDQSIYAFRGAVPANVLKAERTLKAQRKILGTNFRSDAVIVEASRRLISEDPSHQPKAAQSASSSSGAICVQKYQDFHDEAVSVARRINELVSSCGIQKEEIAVIARARSRLSSVLDELDRAGIPWFERDRLPFDDCWFTELALQMLTCMVEDNGGENVRGLMDALDDGGVPHAIQRDGLELAMGLHGICSERSALTIAEFDNVLACSNARSWLSAATPNASEAARLEAQYAHLMQSLTLESARVGSMALAVRRFRGRDAVQVMTGHGSKGREFEAVFVVGLEEGSLPSYRASTTESLAEERRVFYVALTRAKHVAHLSHVLERPSKLNKPWRQKPSRFLNLIAADLRSPWAACIEALRGQGRQHNAR